MFFQHTRIRNCLHLLSSRPVTRMTGCAARRTMRMNGMALKMGVCLSVASFAHLAMTGILKGMGVSGGRLLRCLSDSHEIKDFGSLLILVRSFSAVRKRMNIRECREPFPAFWPHRKKKYIRQCKQHVYKKK